MAEKEIMGAVEGRDPQSQRKAREWNAQRQAQGEHLPKAIGLGKQEGMNFMSFCNQQGSRTGVLKVGRLGWARALRSLPYSYREGRKTALGQIA